MAGGEKGGVDVPTYAVGGGPMPVYAGQRAAPGAGEPSEALFLKFDAQPGSMVWQLVGAPADGSSGNQGALYMRGHLPLSDSPNYLDPVHVARWEVAVVPGGKQAGMPTKWVRAKRLRLVRGAEGAAIGLAPIVYCNCRGIEYKRRVVDW